MRFLRFKYRSHYIYFFICITDYNTHWMVKTEFLYNNQHEAQKFTCGMIQRTRIFPMAQYWDDCNSMLCCPVQLISILERRNIPLKFTCEPMLCFYSLTYLPPANEVCEGYVFTPVCQSFCSGGACMVGVGMRGGGVGVHVGGGHA